MQPAIIIKTRTIAAANDGRTTASSTDQLEAEQTSDIDISIIVKLEIAAHTSSVQASDKKTENMDAPPNLPAYPPSEAAYRAAKIDFVSNHAGTSLGEIAAVTLLGPLSYFAHSALMQCALSDAAPARAQRMLRSRVFEFASHLLVVEGSTLLGVTVYAHRLHELYQALCLLLIWCIVWAWAATGSLGAIVQPVRASTTHALDAIEAPYKHFISVYRAHMMLMTVMAILAVDFFVFPRRFAKTEEFGFGLMDVGVGSFIVSNALVSALARDGGGGDRAADKKKHDDLAVQTRATTPSLFKRVVKSVSPMLVMGSARFFAIRSTNYQEHVTEYGVHWNFFFTLAIVALLSTLVSARPPVRAGALAAVLIGAYQYALQYLGLEQYILHAPRVDFVSANKEGICSSIGYFALYLFGVELGYFLNRNAPRNAQLTDTRWREHQARWWWRKLGLLVVLSAVLLGATVAAHTYIAPCSRRMVNLAYVFWSLYVNAQGLACVLAVSLLLPRATEGFLPAAINANQLFVFLISNLSTGAINLSMHTLYADAATAMFVLCAYLGAVCTVAGVFKAYRVSTVFWK